MQDKEKKSLEKDIIEIAEQIIESTIKTCETSSFKQTDVDKSVELVSSLASKLLIYIDGDYSYIPEILHQIIEQKLPDQRILTNLSNFSEHLQKILQEGIERFQLLTNRGDSNTQAALLEKSSEISQTLESQATSDTEITWDEFDINNKSVNNEVKVQTLNIEEEISESDTDETETYLRKIFPDFTLLKNYKLHGITLNYYFPELKLALEKEDAHLKAKSKVWTEYHCNKAGIKLHKIREKDLTNFRNFNRSVKQLVSNQKCL